MEIVIIAAMAANRVIGRNGTIPWNIAEELFHFKETTWGWPLVMGRKTFESIGRPLPGRRNIVITRQAEYRAPGCETVDSLAAALALCVETAKVFVIGGEQIFAQALPQADTVILTTLGRSVEGDTVLPEFERDFRLVEREEVAEPEPYTIEVYRRK